MVAKRQQSRRTTPLFTVYKNIPPAYKHSHQAVPEMPPGLLSTMRFIWKKYHSDSYLPIQEERKMSNEPNENTQLILRPHTPPPLLPVDSDTDVGDNRQNSAQEASNSQQNWFRTCCQSCGNHMRECYYPLTCLLVIIGICAGISRAITFGTAPWLNHGNNTEILPHNQTMGGNFTPTGMNITSGRDFNSTTEHENGTWDENELF